MRLSNFIRTFIFAALVVIAAGHGVIIAATGNVGGEGTALGGKRPGNILVRLT